VKLSLSAREERKTLCCRVGGKKNQTTGRSSGLSLIGSRKNKGGPGMPQKAAQSLPRRKKETRAARKDYRSRRPRQGGPGRKKKKGNERQPARVKGHRVTKKTTSIKTGSGRQGQRGGFCNGKPPESRTEKRQNEWTKTRGERKISLGPLPGFL